MKSRLRLIPSLLLLPILGACIHDNTDAWGNFEAVEVRISSEVPGRLLRLDPREGDQIAAGKLVAQVDTSAVALQRAELLAQEASVRAKTGEISANIASIEGQLVIARREAERMTRLQAGQAATPQQVDRAARDVTVLSEQLKALQASQQVVDQEIKVSQATLVQLEDRVHRGRVIAPISGTVLTRYVEPGEMVQAGTPLLAVASLDTLTFRAYLGGDQLTQLHLGSSVWVRVDAGNGTLRTFPGRVNWIASTAEFTPTPIQTRKERITQVYAVKVAVANPGGILRIGMPGELRFTADTSSK